MKSCFILQIKSTTNIRELEGALFRVVAYSSLENKDINADLAAEALKSIIPSSNRKLITIKDIQREVGEQYGSKNGGLCMQKNEQNRLPFLDKLQCIYQEN